MRKMDKEDIIFKAGVVIIAIIWLSGFITIFININNLQSESYPKLVVKGEVIEMGYWNRTTEDINPNFNLISREKENLTEYYCNLTIFNILTLSRVNYIFEKDIITHYNIQIGSCIEIYEYTPFLRINVYN